MSNLNAAADAVRSFAGQFKSVIDLAEAVDKIGSLDGAIEDREKNYSQLREKESELKKVVEAAEAAVVSASTQSQAIIQGAMQEANDIREQAKHRAASAHKAALADTADAVKAAQQDIAKVQSEKASAEKRLGDLQLQISEAADKLAVLKNEFESLRAKFK